MAPVTLWREERKMKNRRSMARQLCRRRNVWSWMRLAERLVPAVIGWTGLGLLLIAVLAAAGI